MTKLPQLPRTVFRKLREYFSSSLANINLNTLACRYNRLERRENEQSKYLKLVNISQTTNAEIPHIIA